MTTLEQSLIQAIRTGIEARFGFEPAEKDLALQPTRREFRGDFTLVTFPFVKAARLKPEEFGQALGQYLLAEHAGMIAEVEVIKGFLNLRIRPEVWVHQLAEMAAHAQLGVADAHGRRVMVEYSSPNTNKPLHLGHLRNNFLGHSIARILAAAGYQVRKVNLVNDRGIHICKSMLAYQLFGQGETPSASLKGDKLVGNYYVRFDKEYRRQIQEAITDYQARNPEVQLEKLKEELEKSVPIMRQAQDMLRRWEAGDPETIALWKRMNGWVYEGFEQTYKTIGVDFDQFYYESNTYLLGKQVVEEGLEKGVFYRRPDGSVWIDLTEDGLDHKLVLRADGTSVYLTQDLGTADLKYRDYPMEKSVYVVGNEQDYHFKVLQIIMRRLGRPYAAGIYHFSYGMVELPEGKMKSREGTVVDADDLIAEMVEEARQKTSELGKAGEMSTAEAEKLYRTLALGALKFFILRVEPTKKMLFNPKESIDFQGDTGVYLQYIHARCCAILRRAAHDGLTFAPADYAALQHIEQVETDLIALLALFPKKVQAAAENYSPAEIAQYLLDTGRQYSKFFTQLSIFGAEDPALRAFRIALSAMTAQVLQRGLDLLGIEAPERM